MSVVYDKKYAVTDTCVRCGKTTLVWRCSLTKPVRYMDQQFKYSKVLVCEPCGDIFVAEWWKQMCEASDLVHRANHAFTD